MISAWWREQVGQPDADKSGQGGEKAKNYQIFVDVLYGQPNAI